MKKVFIDGQAGTTGLQIKELVLSRSDLELLKIPEEHRKDQAVKRSFYKKADIVILCLPDDAAKDSAALAEKTGTRVIDASTAHRVSPEWVYGFAEIEKSRRGKVKAAQRVSNPGCHATGFIALAAPLIRAGIVPADYPFAVTSLTGYSGGGKQMIAGYSGHTGDRSSICVKPYGLTLKHKHIPEMKHYAGLTYPPAFYPVVGDFERGMIVSFPLESRLLPGNPVAQSIHGKLSDFYSGEPCIRVLPFDTEKSSDNGFLTATSCNHTNRLDIMVFGNDRQILCVARLDNLGKGASGAAMQNMNIMLGLDELAGLAV